MSNKDLIEEDLTMSEPGVALQRDLNHLRIRYGTSNVYRTLMKQMRDEFEELSSLFGVSSGNMPSSTFYPTTSTEFYKEYMDVIARAAHDTLEEQHTAPASFYDLETQSIDAESIHGDEFSLCPEEEEDNIEDMDLLQQILKDISCWPSANPLSGGSASSEISPETPVGETADTHEGPHLKIIQTGGAGAAPEDASKKRPLKMKQPTEPVAVIKETPAKPKKKKNQ